LALDPREIVSDISERAHRLGVDPVDDSEAPAVLRRPVGSGLPLPPMRESPAVADVHKTWARVHAADAQPATNGSGLRGAVRARIGTAAAEVTGPAQRDDRALIGTLIRAVDALAQRCDELAGRVADLEGLVEEVVNVLGEDLVRLRAVLDHTAVDRASVSGSVTEPPGRGRVQGTGTATGDG
jgi:hypothetical protein